MSSLDASVILFDMDGTLVDSQVIVVKVWSRFAERFGIDVDEILETSHGVRMADTVARWLPGGEDADAVIADLSAFEYGTVDGADAVPGAAAFMASLPVDRIAVVTSAGRDLARSRLAGVGLTVPTVLITAEDVDHGKPAPDCYLAGAAALGAAPEDAIVFEDAEAGIVAGLDAGMHVVVVGDWRSERTRGLPRIADYRGIRTAVDSGGITITLPSAARS